MWRPEAVAPALETSQVEARSVRQAKDLAVTDDRPTVFLLDAESRSIFPVDVMRAFVDAGGAIVALGRNGETDVPEGLPTEFLSGFLTQPTSPRRLLVAIRAGFREAAARAETARARGEAAQRAREIGELTRIGVALGTERDIKTLLELILTQARRITQSDAGSLYLVEINEHGDRRLRFRLAQTYSKPEAPFVEHTIGVDRGSLAGYCAVTGDPLVIDDAYFLHTTGGYLLGVALSSRWVFDLKPDDTFWCTADVGWVTGHSYLVYGPLALGATCVMYEGAPNWPDKNRFWEICERYGVTILYTAPTAIRAFMKWGDHWPAKHDLSRLRLLGSVGEPINPEAWMWYREHIGGNRCPIVDTWWQTETGSIVISPLPAITATKPGSATVPLPGYSAALLDVQGNEIKVGGGLLALTR